MTKLQTWILRKIFANLFIQGPNHHINVARVYQLAREVWHEEFTEDNRPTTDAILREAFNATQFDGRNKRRYRSAYEGISNGQRMRV